MPPNNLTPNVQMFWKLLIAFGGQRVCLQVHTIVVAIDALDMTKSRSYSLHWCWLAVATLNRMRQTAAPPEKGRASSWFQQQQSWSSQSPNMYIQQRVLVQTLLTGTLHRIKDIQHIQYIVGTDRDVHRFQCFMLSEAKPSLWEITVFTSKAKKPEYSTIVACTRKPRVRRKAWTLRSTLAIKLHNSFTAVQRDHQHWWWSESPTSFSIMPATHPVYVGAHAAITCKCLLPLGRIDHIDNMSNVQRHVRSPV